MTRRPLCLAALIFCLAVFISLRLFPPEPVSFSAFEGEGAVVTGTAASVSHKTAWDGQEILRISLKDLSVESPEGLSEILPPDAMILCETDAEASALVPAAESGSGERFANLPLPPIPAPSMQGSIISARDTACA